MINSDSVHVCFWCKREVTKDELEVNTKYPMCKNCGDKLMGFVKNRLIPSFKKEDYVKTLSNKKLARLARRILWPQIPVYSLSEAIFEEMAKRLGDQSGLKEFALSIMSDNSRRESEYGRNV